LLYYFNNFQILQNLLNISELRLYGLEFGTAKLAKKYGFQILFKKIFNFFDLEIIGGKSGFSMF